jgi:hypothetical protein
MALGTNNVTVTTAANFIPEIWSDETIAAYKSNLVVANKVTKINHRGKKGDTIHIPAPTRGSASAKSASTQVTLIAATEGVKNISINKHYEYSRLIEDIVAAQALASLRAFYTSDSGYALAKQTDSDLLALFEGFQAGATTNGTYPNAVIGSDGVTAYDDSANTNTGNGSALSDAGVRKMSQTLDDVDVPLSERFIIVPPVEKKNLLGLSRFTEQAFVGEMGGMNSIRTGKIGDMYGMEVYVSTNCQTITAVDTSTTYRVGGMLHKSAIALAEQVGVRTQSQYKQEWLADLYTADCLYGVGELRDDAGIAFIVPS